MCGIYGVLAKEGSRPDARFLGELARLTVHRGPDDSGTYADGRLLLGMRRLSIIDVSGGHQPMANEDGTLWVVCNGEIYNFRALRARLQAQGHRFRSASDTEVLVHAYEEWGEDFVAHIDGMFAFALWDTRAQRLLVGRDRPGIKPLYYSTDGGHLSFASEAKALLALPWVHRDLDDSALHVYLTLGYSTGERTLFRGIRRLPPATLLIAEREGVRTRTYWTLPAQVDSARSERQWEEEVRAQLDSSVHAQMVSDVPLGAFLSGGVDSSAVVAAMARHSERPVKTYSIGFGEVSGGKLYNELPYARQVAELFGTEHKEILVSPDVASLLPRLLWHLDEPIADAAFITTYLVSKFAREDVTVILSGVGGDELFGGYNRYLDEYYHRRFHALPRTLRRMLQPLVKRLPADRHAALPNVLRLLRAFVLSSELPFEERYASYMHVFDAPRQRRLHGAVAPDDPILEAFALSQSPDYLHRLLSVDLATQLPDDLLMLTDKMSMAVSLECRVPLLDTALVELAARMPASLKIRGRQLKHILKRSLAGSLPPEILHRSKRGFGAPVGAWLKNELRPLLDRYVGREAVEARGLFRWAEVEETISLHLAGREDHTDHLMSLLNLELWCRLFLDRIEPEALAGDLPESRAA